MAERTSRAQLQWQVESIGNQLSASAPEDVGFLVMFFHKGQRAGETPVAFATNEQLELVRSILRDFERRGSPIVRLDDPLPG